jgi:hypothetical protein
MGRKSTKVSLAGLAAALEGVLNAPSAKVVAMVTMAPEASDAVEEAPKPEFTDYPQPPIAGVKRRTWGPGEKEDMEASHAKLREALEAGVKAAILKGKEALKEEERLANEQLRRADLEARLSEALKLCPEIYGEVLAELLADNDDIKEEISKMDVHVRHEASFASVQDYWTAALKEAEAEKVRREAEINENFAALEALARARKARQAANRDQRAEENRQRASKGSGGKGKDGKKGGKGK